MGMKSKAAITLAGLFLIVALCGCGSKSAGNTIGPLAISDPQAQAVVEILSNGGYSAFAGFDVDETYQSAKMGIEYYKDGKLVKEQGQGTFMIDEASQGVAGFNCVNGKASMGFSAAGSTGTVSDIKLRGYTAKNRNQTSFISMAESQDISDGQKIYLGAVNAGSDTLDTSVIDPSEDKGNLGGKTWLFYVEFSTDPSE